MLARLTAFVILSALLGACSTFAETSSVEPVNTQVVRDVTGLGAQSLAPGECGLFGWETSADPDFVFFSTLDRALYVSGEGTVETLTPRGPFPAEDYGSYQLTLGGGEPLIDGIRYASARMTNTLADGFTRVRPLVILQTCQTPARSDD
jgi:hypothetical protein